VRSADEEKAALRTVVKAAPSSYRQPDPNTSADSLDPLKVELRGELSIKVHLLDDRTDASSEDRVLIPWIEINSPVSPILKSVPEAVGAIPGQSQRDFCLQGLKDWAKVTDTVIVTTQADNAQYLYPYLMERKPANLRIIGGLKPGSKLRGTTRRSTDPYDFTYLGSVEEKKGWAYLVDRAEYITTVTQNNIVMLDNEGALWRFNVMEEKCDIDPDELANRLALFNDRGIQVWSWLPSILGTVDTERRAQTMALVVAWRDGLKNSVIFAYNMMWYGWQNVEEKALNHKEMVNLMGQKFVYDYLIVTPDGYMHYPNKKIRCHIAQETVLKTASVSIIYSGAKNWLPVSAAFADSFVSKGDR
jgi:hypothetical protein